MTLDLRKQQVLEAIVECHIETAEPVSSRSIARKYNLGVSPATIRNEMADLEEIGLIKQPHTSAGRVPSQKGYRYYVDKLMKKAELTPREEKTIRAIFAKKVKVLADLIQCTLKAVTELTDYLVFLSGPYFENDVLKKIKIVQLMPGKALLVIMAETGWVHSKAMDLSSDIGTDDLAYIELVLNRYFQGLTFKQITRTVLNAVYNELIKYRKTINNILEIMEMVLQEEMKENLYLGGTNRILKQPEYSDIEEVRNLMNFIEKEENLRMILQDADPYKVTVKIGEEIKSEQASKYSAVTAVYKLGGNIMGVLGLLGPMRMDYARAMTVVEHMTDALSEALSEEKFF